LACDGLWDVCSDQEAVDLVRSTSDPQAASKLLVDHALGRFSTDNLSCMVVRFDNSALKARKQDGTIGVEGDPETGVGGISEADAIVKEAKRAEEADEGDREGVIQMGRENTIPEEEERKEEGQAEEIKLDPEAPKLAIKKAAGS